MSLSRGLLEILCCPETKQELTMLDGEILRRINKGIGAGEVRNRGGNRVHELMEEALVRADGLYCYPVRQNIPIMLIDEAIEVAPFSA